MRVLVIEDDEDVSAFIVKGLRENRHVADTAFDGTTGLFLATTESYDALIVDRMLPKLDGITILKTLRGADNHTPALILSALGEVDDRVTGLQAGADDYLVKPFAFKELLARLDALMRRGQNEHAEISLKVGDLEIDLLGHKVIRAGQVIALQPREFRLLEYLVRHKGQVVTRTMLLENVWDYHFDPQTNVIDVHISRIRTKIDKGFDRQLLKTIRGVGYVIDEAI